MKKEQLPKNWSTVKLEETGEYINGFAFKPNHRESTGLPIIRIQNLTDETKPLNRTNIAVPSAYEVFRGDMLVSWSATLDVFIWRREKALVNQHIFKVNPEESVIKKSLLFYWLKIAIADLQETEHLHGSTMKHINRGPFLAHEVPLPPSAEQTRIVEKLEELLSDLDAGVSELKAAQKKLGQYRQSLLKAAVEGALTAQWRAQHTPTETGAQLLERILKERRVRWEAKQLAKFEEQGKAPPKDWRKNYPEPTKPNTVNLPKLPNGWGWATIEQISSDAKHSLAIGPFGSDLKVSDYRDAGTPLVFVRNIRAGQYGGTRTKYISSEKAAELYAHSVIPGDVLITKMGEPPGDADVYPDNQPAGVITADCIKVSCWPGLLKPDCLKAAINSYIGQRQIKPITQGVAQKKVSLGRFAGIAIPIPPAAEQTAIMEFLSAADNDAKAQGAAIELALKQSAAQRKNILKAAFSGQLVPQDPGDEPAAVLLERIRAERAHASAPERKPRRGQTQESA